LLVLRKQTSEEVGFLDEITADIRPEVERQLETMLALDDKEDPNFSDSDYQLAAYAAALRVLTQYKSIEDLNVERELAKPRVRGEKSPIEQVIESAVKIASNYLIPKALHDEEATRRDIWRKLSAEEKFYLKGLEAESHGEFRHGVYQEFARGFGLKEYTFMLENGKANGAKLKTACEFKRREFGTAGFGSSLTRHILFSVSKVCETGNVKDGMKWLKEEIDGDYWAQRQTIASLLRYLSKLPIEHWRKDAEAARLLAGAVENDRV
jgi:putative DNA methylase